MTATIYQRTVLSIAVTEHRGSYWTRIEMNLYRLMIKQVTATSFLSDGWLKDDGANKAMEYGY